MWKLMVGFLAVTIFAVLLSLGNDIRVLAALAQILLTAFGAISVMVAAISIATWLESRG